MRLPRKARRWGLAAAALVPALLLPAAPGVAGTVTSLDDSGAGTLRSEIALAAPGDTIVVLPGLTGTILLNSELVIDKNLTIDGPGARLLAISGGDATRVVRVSQPGAHVVIEGVTVRDGLAGDPLPFGGGLLVEFADRVRLERVALVDNAADSGAAFPGLGGGAFVRDGSLELVDSTVAGNRVPDDNGGGGGLFIAGATPTFAIDGSTIAGNQADLGAGLTAAGAHGTIEDSTIARNVAEAGGGIVGSPSATLVTVTRSLITSNEAATDPACSGLVTSTGNTVIDALGGCGLTTGPGDAIGDAAPVGALGDNGGPTDTLLPLAGNPAIDRIAGPCAGTDQRGFARPHGSGCDAGAVELRQGLAASGPLTLGSAQVGQSTAPVSVTITNVGDLDAQLTAVTLGGPDAGEVEPVADPAACTDSTLLGPGMSCKLAARLSPTSVGAKQAMYTVASAGSSVDVAVTGTGDPVPPPPPNQGGSSNTAPPPPSSADAVLVGTSTRAARSGRLKLRLRCTTVGAARCAGSLTLKLGSRKLTKAYSIAAGTEARVTLKLGAGDRRRLARRRSLRSAVTVITTQPDGSRRTTHQRSVKLLRA